jgi:hypothetical protein
MNERRCVYCAVPVQIEIARASVEWTHVRVTRVRKIGKYRKIVTALLGFGWFGTSTPVGTYVSSLKKDNRSYAHTRVSARGSLE